MIVWKAFERLLLGRTVVVLAVLFLAGGVLTYWSLRRLSTRLVETSALEAAELQAGALLEFRALYTSEVVDRVRGRGVDVAHDYRAREGSIPLPATLTIELGERFGKAREGGMSFRLYSDQPFPWRTDGGPRDEFEAEALRRLRQDPETPFYRFESWCGQATLRYAVADRMRPGCVSCHNEHPLSTKRDWKEGDVLGALEVIQPLEPVVAETERTLGETMLFLSSLACLALVGIVLVVGRLRMAARDLGRQVAERTADLAETNRELESFGRSVSHDLRAPLRGILGLAGILGEDHGRALEGDGRQVVEEIRSSARQGLVLIDDLLALSRAVRSEMRSEEIDMAGLVRSVYEECRAAEPGARVIALEVEDLPPGRGDRALVRQVWSNLLANAIKFTRPRAEAHLHVGSRRDEGETVYFVRDNGVGFDGQLSGRLFEEFQRLHPVEEFEGTGLGLALVRRIARRHGGRVQAEGTIGEGAVFSFSLGPEEGP